MEQQSRFRCRLLLYCVHWGKQTVGQFYYVQYNSDVCLEIIVACCNAMKEAHVCMQLFDYYNTAIPSYCNLTSEWNNLYLHTSVNNSNF